MSCALIPSTLLPTIFRFNARKQQHSITEPKIKRCFIIRFFYYITLACLLLVLTFYTIFPAYAYYFSSKPISKGIDGYSIVYIVSFRSEAFLSFIEHPANKKATFLLDANFIERQPEIVQSLKKRNYTVGLVSTGEALDEELQLFESELESRPLWLTTNKYDFTSTFLKEAHKEGINCIAPTIVFNENLSTKDIQNGGILFIEVNETFDFNSAAHQALISSANIRSLEENIFNLKTKEKHYP